MYAPAPALGDALLGINSCFWPLELKSCEYREGLVGLSIPKAPPSGLWEVLGI